MRHIEGLRRGGTTIVFVSHDLPAVERLCDRAIFLSDGVLHVIGGDYNDAVTIVNNNHCLSQGLRNLNIAYEGRSEPNRKGECYEYRETDFAKVAHGYGLTACAPLS